jgi:hypothetical protein
MFAARLANLYLILWFSLLIGNALAVVGIPLVQYLFFDAAISVIFEWFFALGLIFPVGACFVSLILEAAVTLSKYNNSVYLVL